MTMIKLKLLLAQWHRYYYVLYLMVNFFVYGMTYSVFPLIMVDMKYVLNTTYTLITLYSTIETVGYCLGPLVPLLYNKYPNYVSRQLVMAVFMILLAIATAMIPLVPNLWLLYVCAFVFGFGGSINDCGNTPWTIEIFQDKSAPYLQMNNFMFGVGNALSAAVLRSYIVGEEESNDDIHDDGIDLRARLSLPVALICCVVITVPLSSVFMYFFRRYKAPESTAPDCDEKIEFCDTKLFDSKRIPRKAIRILFSLWFTSYVVVEIMFLKFVDTYFQQQEGINGKKASDLFMISTVVYSGFRFLYVFISMKIRAKHIIIVQYIVLIIGSLLFVWSQFNTTVLWAAAPVMFCGFSSMMASIQAFTSQHLTMSDNMNTSYILTSGLFILMTPNIIGPFIHDHSYVFLIVTLTYLCSSIALFTFILHLIRRYQRVLIN